MLPHLQVGVALIRLALIRITGILPARTTAAGTTRVRTAAITLADMDRAIRAAITGTRERITTTAITSE